MQRGVLLPMRSKNYNRKLNVTELFTSCYLLYQKENTFNLIGFHMRKDVMKKRSLFLEVIFLLFTILLNLSLINTLSKLGDTKTIYKNRNRGNLIFLCLDEKKNIKDN